MGGVNGGPDSMVLIALLLPAAVFLLLGLVAPLRRTGRLAALVSIAGAAASLGFAFVGWRAMDGVQGGASWLWTWLPGHGADLATVGVVADAQSTLMLLLVTLVAFLVQLYSLGYLHDEPPAALGRYYAYQSLFAFSMMGLVLAPNLLQLFICWELVGLCSYLLIGFWYKRPAAARAAVKAFWTTKLGDVGMLIGIVMLWRLTGTFDLADLREMASLGRIPVEGLGWITFCLYLGAMGKSAQFPLHIWLPDAMEGPTPVSALIHAATMVTAGVYLLTRTHFLFALTPDVLVIVAWVGAVTALMAAVLACVQTDIKRVLAYSTVSQLGYMMTAIGAGAALAGFFHLLTHGVFKALLFLGAGAVIHAVGTNDITRMGGLMRRMPMTAIVFIIGTLSLAGLPLFAGFLSKEHILTSVLAGGFAVPFAMLLLGAFLTAFYMLRVVILTFFGRDAWEVTEGTEGTEGAERRGGGDGGLHGAGVHDAHSSHGHVAHDPGLTMMVPLWVLALLSMAIGVYYTFQHVDIGSDGPPWLAPVAIGVATAGLLLAWLTYSRRAISADALASAFGPIRRAALAGFWIDDAFVLVYRTGVLTFSRLIGWVDRYLVDGVVNVASAWTVMLGGTLRRVQTGKVQDYATAVTVGVLLLLWWIGGAL